MSLGEAFPPVLFAAQSNAGWAYERLYQDLAPVVLGYLRVQGAREPEDLTSEVFLGAFGRLGQFHGSEDQWVFTTASALVDERHRGSCRPVIAPDAGEPADREGGDVEADALNRLGEQRVRQLCAAVPPA
jgi:RNA polymerase sigma-70 factor (ECF subfamily)